MNIHDNAPLTVRGREEAVRRVMHLSQSARAVARAMHTTDTTVRKWVARARAGEALTDRSSRPRSNPAATPRRPPPSTCASRCCASATG